MKRTIVSSLLFFLPINLASHHRDQWMMYLYILMMSVSVVNHSHTYHPDRFRRVLFAKIDMAVVHLLLVVFTARWLYLSPTWQSVVYIVGFLTTLGTIYFHLLEGKFIEEYSEFQRNAHVVMHITAVFFILFASHHFCYKDVHTVA